MLRQVQSEQSPYCKPPLVLHPFLLCFLLLLASYLLLTLQHLCHPLENPCLVCLQSYNLIHKSFHLMGDHQQGRSDHHTTNNKIIIVKNLIFDLIEGIFTLNMPSSSFLRSNALSHLVIFLILHTKSINLSSTLCFFSTL